MSELAVNSLSLTLGGRRVLDAVTARFPPGPGDRRAWPERRGQVDAACLPGRIAPTR